MMPTILFREDIEMCIYIYTYIINTPRTQMTLSFVWKRPCFGWLTFKNREHWGPRYMYIYIYLNLAVFLGVGGMSVRYVTGVGLMDKS